MILTYLTHITYLLLLLLLFYPLKEKWRVTSNINFGHYTHTTSVQLDVNHRNCVRQRINKKLWSVVYVQKIIVL